MGRFFQGLPVLLLPLLLGGLMLAGGKKPVHGAESPAAEGETAVAQSEELEDSLTDGLPEQAAVEESGGQAAATTDLTAEVRQELLLDSRNSPRLHLYDGEETVLLSSAGSRSLVTMADGRFTRRLYDVEYRLQSRVTWQAGGGSSEGMSPVNSPEKSSSSILEPPKLILQEDYYYYSDSHNRQRVVLTDFQEVSRMEHLFSPEGLLIREEIYRFFSDEDDGASASLEKGASVDGGLEGEEKTAGTEIADLPMDPWKDFPQLTLTMQIVYQYNEEKALAEKVVIHRVQDEEFTERTVYHDPGNIHGGYDLFEDGKLLVSRNYEDESRYTETRHLDNMRIETLHDGARLVSETIYLDGRELRRTEY